MSARVFVCLDCGANVASHGEIAANDQDLCAGCRYLRDCGANVASHGEIAANDQDLCAGCRYLREIEDPADRALLAAFLCRLHVIDDP